MRPIIRIATLLLLLATFPAVADEATAEEDVVLYTNADVEKLEPLPTGQPLAHARFDSQAWAFVSGFVARERARINEDRDHELERDRVEIEADRPAGYGERYPYYLRVPYYDPLPRKPRTAPIARERETPSATQISHPMFRGRPPVREFTPGLGDAYRGQPTE